jgi:hypothetical protein
MTRRWTPDFNVEVALELLAKCNGARTPFERRRKRVAVFRSGTSRLMVADPLTKGATETNGAFFYVS